MTRSEDQTKQHRTAVVKGNRTIQVGDKIAVCGTVLEVLEGGKKLVVQYDGSDDCCCPNCDCCETR